MDRGAIKEKLGMDEAIFGESYYRVLPDGSRQRLRSDWVDKLYAENPANGADPIGYLYRPGGTADAALWEVLSPADVNT